MNVDGLHGPYDILEDPEDNLMEVKNEYRR